MKNLFFFLMMLCVVSFSGVATAAPGLPMVTSPLSNGEDLAVRIETGNGLAPGADYVSAFQQIRPELGISNPAAAAEEARGLHPCSPPAGKYLVSRVKDGKTSTRVRSVSSQEQALCDENGNVIALSKCGNISKPVEHHAAPPAPQALPVPVAVAGCSWCALANQPLQFAPALNPALFTEQVKVCEKGTECDAWLRGGEMAVDLGQSALIMYGLRGIKIGGASASASGGGGSSSSPAATSGSSPIDPGTDLFGVDPGPRP